MNRVLTIYGYRVIAARALFHLSKQVMSRPKKYSEHNQIIQNDKI